MATKLVDGVRVTLTTDEETTRTAEDAASVAEIATDEAANGYKYLRAKAYPQLCEQLDMLYHAMTTDTLDTTCDFYTTLKAVKDTYPKP